MKDTIGTDGWLDRKISNVSLVQLCSDMQLPYVYAGASGIFCAT